MTAPLPQLPATECRNSIKWPGELPGSHVVAARFAVLVVAAGVTSVKPNGRPTFSISWNQAQDLAREAGYVDNGFGYLPMGWVGEGSFACLSRGTRSQHRPPLRVGLAMRAFAAAHEDCAGASSYCRRS